MMAIAHPAATVVPLRDADNDIELLLLQRNPELSFHGGAWVFPGGRLDAEDYARANDDIIAAARFAAVREAGEEAGLRIAPEDLVWISRWTTPNGFPKRFKTWFFIAPAAAGEIRIDNGEIHDYQWISPHQALTAYRQGALELPPPTAASIDMLTPYHCVNEVIQDFSSKTPLIYDFGI